MGILFTMTATGRLPMAASVRSGIPVSRFWFAGIGSSGSGSGSFSSSSTTASLSSFTGSFSSSFFLEHAGSMDTARSRVSRRYNFFFKIVSLPIHFSFIIPWIQGTRNLFRKPVLPPSGRKRRRAVPARWL